MQTNDRQQRDTEEREQARRREAAPRVLALAVFSASVLSGVVNCWSMARSSSPRIRDDLGLFLALRRAGQAINVEALQYAPSSWSLPIDPSRISELFGLFGHALVLHTSLGCILALAVMGLARAANRVPSSTRFNLGNDGGNRFGVAAAFFLGAAPALYPAIRELLFDLPTWVKPLIWLSLLGQIPAGTALLLRDAGSAERLARRAAWLAGALLVAAVAGALATEGAEPQPSQHQAAAGSPNILLISIDSLRSDHLGSYGYGRDTSPAIDLLAREGVLFSTALAPSTWTLPSQVTLLTSLPPEQHGLATRGRNLASVATTLAEVVLSAGYQTTAWVAGPFLESRYGYAQGFESYDDYSFIGDTPGQSRLQVTSDRLIDRVREWLGDWDRRGRRRPFFLFLHIWDAHHDFAPPAPYDRLFDPDYAGEITGKDFKASESVRPDMDPRDLEHVIALYDGEIRFVDDQLARLVAQLEALQTLDETIVVVTSDHGEEFFEHGQKGHLNNLFDETLRVPLVMRFPPALPRGSVIDQQVRLMDVGLTLLELARIEAPEGFGRATPSGERPGASLVDLARGNASGEPERLAFADLMGRLASARSGDFKLIRSLNGEGAEQVYDLQRDPMERVDVSTRVPAAGSALADKLDWWRALSENSGILLSREVHRSPEHEERLRALGYIDPNSDPED